MNRPEFIVVGKGGREHCLVEVLSEGGDVYSLGGSDAIRKKAPPLDEEGPLPLDEPLTEDMIGKILEREEATLIFGPEAPLAEGWVNQILEKNPNYKILGPSREATSLESSKWWAKDFMKRHNVPTPRAVQITEPSQFHDVVYDFKSPYVIKADGLAGGKGVGVFHEKEKALEFVKDILVHKKFGEQTSCLLEEFLPGQEVSVFLLMDGKSAVQIGNARDYKRLREGETGPNTGGMGAYSPVEDITAEDRSKLFRTVIRPLIRGLKEENIFYKGFLYLGLMKSDDGFSILELNVRLGDPEAQVLLPLYDSQAVEIISRAGAGQLSNLSREQGILQLDSNFWVAQPEGAAVCVVMASPGYCNEEETQVDIPLPGLEEYFRNPPQNVHIFHSGTRQEGEKWVTEGGRVLNVVAKADTVGKAREKCYQIISKLSYSRLYYRKDIALKARGEKGGERSKIRRQDVAVSIVMGSSSDLPVMKESAEVLEELGIPCEMRILSAHRSPDAAIEYAREAEDNGLEVIIAGAGGAAHLAGMIAGKTILPVIGVPMKTSALGGQDSLLSTVQMPSGVPVGTMAIGKSGAQNAAIYAAMILAGRYPKIKKALKKYKKLLSKRVLDDDRKLTDLGYEDYLKEKEGGK